MKPNSKKWKEIIAIGCGGYWHETADGREFDCEHSDIYSSLCFFLDSF